MKIANSVVDLIGNTPLVRLRLDPEDRAEILAKVEYFNPGGSVKDRPALAMIADAEARGVLKPGGTIVEPTSGNTGIALAMIAAGKGYRLILVMPETMSVERRAVLKAYGAELVLTPGELGMRGAIAKAQELLAENPDWFMPSQFENPANPQIHEATTAREIWDDTDGGQIDAVVGGVGTGGTITGIGRFFAKQGKKIQIVAVEPAASAVLSGEKPGPHKQQGIGAGFIPPIVDQSLIDRVIKVTDEEAIATTGRLAKEEGLLVGISSGSAVTAALTVAKELGKGKRLVVILPDTGLRYLSVPPFSL